MDCHDSPVGGGVEVGMIFLMTGSRNYQHVAFPSDISAVEAPACTGSLRPSHESLLLAGSTHSELIVHDLTYVCVGL